MKSRDQKEALLKCLKQTPIVELACKNAGIGRTTFYRWKKQSSTFSRSVEAAMKEGFDFINDLAETQLVSSIRDKKFPAIAYWLNHRHPSYGNKVEIVDKTNGELTDAQRKLLAKAIGLEAQDANDDSYDGKEKNK
jgi:hypothetical protein